MSIVLPIQNHITPNALITTSPLDSFGISELSVLHKEATLSIEELIEMDKNYEITLSWVGENYIRRVFLIIRKIIEAFTMSPFLFNMNWSPSSTI